MRLSQVDLNLFIVLEAIYQQRNLTRAADVLCITQPAVSNALARLRHTLDDPLFVRTSQGMMPTPLVENIIGRVQDALQLLTTSVTEGEVFDPAKTDKVFRFSMNDLTEAMILPGLLEQLQKLAPNTVIECYQVNKDDVERELSSGTLDFALGGPLISGSHLCATPLIKQRYACVVRKDHPLAGDEISLEQYLALDHIVVSSRRKGVSYEDAVLQRLGRSRRIRTRVQHYQVAPLLLKRTDMALTMPISVAEKYGLKVFELPFNLPELDWNLFWHKSADHDKANMWMRNLLLDVSGK